MIEGHLPRKAINDKGMPAHKIGRLWKFKKVQVDEWVEKGGVADKASQSDSD